MDDGVKIHPSHEIEEDWDVPGDHVPLSACTICKEATCSLCPLDDDEPLAVSCLGFSRWQSITITGDDGIQRTVRKSGIGWPA